MKLFKPFLNVVDNQLHGAEQNVFIDGFPPGYFKPYQLDMEASCRTFEEETEPKRRKLEKTVHECQAQLELYKI